MLHWGKYRKLLVGPLTCAKEHTKLIGPWGIKRRLKEAKTPLRVFPTQGGGSGQKFFPVFHRTNPGWQQVGSYDHTPVTNYPTRGGRHLLPHFPPKRPKKDGGLSLTGRNRQLVGEEATLFFGSTA